MRAALKRKGRAQALPQRCLVFRGLAGALRAQPSTAGKEKECVAWLAQHAGHWQLPIWTAAKLRKAMI
eukprot:335491-Alexandrium_andersonii.AAC.1